MCLYILVFAYVPVHVLVGSGFYRAVNFACVSVCVCVFVRVQGCVLCITLHGRGRRNRWKCSWSRAHQSTDSQMKDRFLCTYQLSTDTMTGYRVFVFFSAYGGCVCACVCSMMCIMCAWGCMHDLWLVQARKITSASKISVCVCGCVFIVGDVAATPVQPVHLRLSGENAAGPRLWIWSCRSEYIELKNTFFAFTSQGKPLLLWPWDALQ